MKEKIKEILRSILSNLKIRNIIIFESKPDYSDNTKAVFDYLIKQKYNDKYIFVWLVDDRNKYKNIKIKNVMFVNFKDVLKKIYYISRAKYIINCNRPITKFNKNSIAINLWHGTLLKNLKDLNCMKEENTDYLLCPSEKYIKIYEEQLHINKSKFLILNNPRNDYLFSKNCNLHEFFKCRYKKFIIWMPTFRQSNNGNRIDSKYNFNKGIPVIQTEEDIIKLNEVLKTYETLLVIKPHFAQDMSIFKVSEFSNIKIVYTEELIKKQMELYEFLGKFDALITDYSSVYFDFLITNKPIAFTIDDIEEYSKGKGFIFKNPQEFMPGKKIKNIREMFDFIKEVKEEKDNYTEERKEICKIVNKYADNKNAERVCNFLKI